MIRGRVEVVDEVVETGVVGEIGEDVAITVDCGITKESV